LEENNSTFFPGSNSLFQQKPPRKNHDFNKLVIAQAKDLAKIASLKDWSYLGELMFENIDELHTFTLMCVRKRIIRLPSCLNIPADKIERPIKEYLFGGYGYIYDFGTFQWSRSTPGLIIRIDNEIKRREDAKGSKR
jgi:hypothetical protein